MKRDKTFKTKLNEEIVLMVLKEYKNGGFLNTLDVQELIPEKYEWFDVLNVLKDLLSKGLVEKIDLVSRGKFKSYGWCLK